MDKATVWMDLMIVVFRVQQSSYAVVPVYHQVRSLVLNPMVKVHGNGMSLLFFVVLCG